MQFRTKRREDPVVEITPLIDVVFLLLLFFMVTTQFISLPGIKLSLPGISPGKSVTATSKIDIHLTADGDIYVDGNPVSFDHLPATLKEAVLDTESSVVVLMADTNAVHGRVVAVMDVLRTHGIKRIVLAARWDEEKHPD
jgi:biopolymer transport protein ExbD